MKNFISPCNHPESYLSGSTIESMINKCKKLEVPYFVSTDNGTLTSILKGYSIAKKKEIKFIAGIEIFFKDENCDIIKNTPSEKIKYFKLIIHVKDQPAYQKLVKMISDQSRRQVKVWEDKYPLFNWNDLSELSQYGVTVSTSNVECMVSKHLLVNRPDLSEKYYLKIKSIFGAENFYPTIIPYRQNKYWDAMVKFDAGNKSVTVPFNNRMEVKEYKDEKDKGKDYKFAKAIDLVKYNKMRSLEKIYINNMPFNVKSDNKWIKNPEIMREFQDLQSDIQTNSNKLIIGLAIKYKDVDNILINSYSYYADKEDKIVQDMKLGDEKRIYQPQYMASTQDVLDYLTNDLGLPEHEIERTIENSYRWANKFKDFNLKYNYQLVQPEGDPKQLLVDIIKKVGRMKWDNPIYVKQFREEFELLTNNGKLDLIPYFLPLVDIYKFYNDNEYLTGPGRGSAGGFLIAYLIGVTHVDPIKYELSSARFATIDRIQQGNMMDIDCDFEDRSPLVGRDGNSGYLFRKYGNRAAQISTRTLLRIKSAILDANRFINGGKVEEEVALLSKSLPNTPQGINDSDYIFGYEDSDGNHVDGLFEINKDLQEYAKNRPQEWELVSRALSLARQNSRHACAYIISNSPVEDTVPIMRVGEVDRVTQPEAKQVESAGLIKYDFLVVSALADINACIKRINKKNEALNMPTGYFHHNGEKVYIWDLPEDQKVFDMLSEGHTESVFQLNTTSVTPFIKRIKPKSILDCATITSLVRPGPLDFVDEETGRNMAEEYIYRRNGEGKEGLPILDELIPETHGILVFQEQVSKIARELGQMSIIDAENIRIGMGKKITKLLDSLKPAFIEGASRKTDKATAEKVWAMMATFARYGFNKSHAVAYSVTSYACAFLKYHYPLEWWASVLSNADTKEINEVFYRYVKDILLPPDINNSSEQIEIDYKAGKIRNKLSTIAGLGGKTASKIIDNRPYSNLQDFVSRKVCGPAIAKKLTYVGVLDSLFDAQDTVSDKIFKYNEAMLNVEFKYKVEKYDQKIKDLEAAGDEKALKRALANKEKLLKKGPSPSYVDDEYNLINAKKDFQIKKSIFPTMNIDLMPVLEKDCSKYIITTKKGKMLTFDESEDGVYIRTGETLQKIDSAMLERDAYFCVPGYVIDASEFAYKKNTKKALKIVIDSSGYISEKVVWPNYNTGILNYPEQLKKGCIAWFIYYKKANSPYINVSDIVIEAESIL